MTPNTRTAARAYLSNAPPEGILWRKSSKGTGKLGGQLSETSALNRWDGTQDLRDYPRTIAVTTPVDRLVDMFGWNSPTMAFQDIEAAHIANHGTARVKLP